MPDFSSRLAPVVTQSFYLSMDFGKREPANNAHALDGGIALLFHISHHWPAASDVIRSAAASHRIPKLQPV